MTLPKYMTTITPFSKVLALGILVILPFVGFYLGYGYRKATYVVETETVYIPKLIPTQVPVAIKKPDADSPAAGICADVSLSKVVKVVLPADNVPMPRCSKVTSKQTLEFENKSGHEVSLLLGGESRKVMPGESAKIDKAFGEYLLPGVYSSVAGEIWLQP